MDRIAKIRTRRRNNAFGEDEGPEATAQHSRRIAEAYIRLAEIEETLDEYLQTRTASTDPATPSP